MYVCKNCGQVYTEYNHYCSKCGGVIVATPPSTPTNPATPTSATYVSYGASDVNRFETKPSRPKVSRGTMLMGVFGFIFAVSSWFGVSNAEGYASSYRYDGIGFKKTFYFDEEVFTIVLFVYILRSVLGLVLSSIARRKGFSGLAVAGKIISIVGIVLNTILFCLALSGEIVTFEDIFHFDIKRK